MKLHTMKTSCNSKHGNVFFVIIQLCKSC